MKDGHRNATVAPTVTRRGKCAIPQKKGTDRQATGGAGSRPTEGGGIKKGKGCREATGKGFSGKTAGVRKAQNPKKSGGPRGRATQPPTAPTTRTRRAKSAEGVPGE